MLFLRQGHAPSKEFYESADAKALRHLTKKRIAAASKHMSTCRAVINNDSAVNNQFCRQFMSNHHITCYRHSINIFIYMSFD